MGPYFKSNIISVSILSKIMDKRCFIFSLTLHPPWGGGGLAAGAYENLQRPLLLILSQFILWKPEGYIKTS